MIDLSTLYLILLAVGVAMLGLGSVLKNKLPPRVSVALIFGGAVIGMIFLNLSLFSVMNAGMR